MESADLLPSARPTRVRYGVLAFACALSMITYLDRVCMGSAAKWIIQDLHLHSEADLKWVFAAFGFAYALFEVPSGWLGDVFGPRSVLVRIVLWWSLFTALTGTVGLSAGGMVFGGVGTLMVVRFLFGMGEAGAYPNITRSLHNWFPYHQRGAAQGAVWMSGRLMGGLTPLLWAALVEGLGAAAATGSHAAVVLLPPLLTWRSAFWLFGLIGLVWAVLFFGWFRNRPEEKPAVNAAELALIRQGDGAAAAAHAGVPWLRVLRSRSLWFLCLMYACQSYGWYFNITYLPIFLETQFGVEKTSLLGAIYKGGPLWMGAAGCLVGGFLTDWFIRRTGNRRLGRKLFGVIGHALAGLCFMACPFAHNVFWMFLAISLSAFCADLTMASSWAVCQDIGRRYAAIVAGFMNMVGNLGGAIGPLLSGYVLDRYLRTAAAGLGVVVEQMPAAARSAALMEGYRTNFWIFAGTFVLGVICWTQIDSTQPVAEE
jgi:ACS family glucarate transporter-like MFS transporter